VRGSSAQVVKRIAEQFAAERATLEDQWGRTHSPGMGD
jgi:hypothetical protein